MAVTVDFNQKDKPKKRLGTKSGTPVTGFDRYALTTARKQGQIALGVWIGILVVICLPWWFSEATLPFAVGMPLWCLFSALGVLFIAPGVLASQLRKSKGAVINAQNQAPVKTLIGKAAKIYGISEPEGFIETPEVPAVKTKPEKAPKPPKTPAKPKVVKPQPEGEERGGLRGILGEAAQALREREKQPKIEKVFVSLAKPSVRAMPGAVILHKDAFENLEPPEISALTVAALVDLRQGHARRLFLLDLVPSLPPTVRLLVWPVVIYARLLDAMWLPHAHQNTDRLALFVVKSSDLMVSALLKDHAARDEKMQELGVTSKDVSNWISQAGYIGSSGAEISTQYKLGRAIHEDPPLESRLQKLQNWGKSPEFKDAVEGLKNKR